MSAAPLPAQMPPATTPPPTVIPPSLTPTGTAPPVVGAGSEAATTAGVPARRLSPEGKPVFNLLFPANVPVSIDQVLLMLKSQSGVTVTPMGLAKGQQIPGPLLKDVTVEEALRAICAQRDWVFWRDRATGNYSISDRAWYEQNILKGTVVQRVIRTVNIPAADAAKAVERMKSAVGEITFDARTNQIFVTDLLPVVEAIERTIRLLDQRVFLRVFTIKHADPKQVMDVLQDYKSPPGRLELIAKMRQIIAEDTYENVQRMEVMVDILDRGPEMRVYDLNNLDFEGKAIQDLQDYLDKDILTEGAYLKFDQQNAVMILRDLPTVHEEVAKLLKWVDKPARQIYIQAEIVETNFTHSFDLGIDWTFSGEHTDLRTQTAATGGTGGAGGPGGTNIAAFQQSAQSTGQLGFRELAEQTLAAAATAKPQDTVNITAGGAGLMLDALTKHAHAVFKAVMEDTETRILAQPRVLVKNRQSADITDGGTISYPTTTYYGGTPYGGQPTTGGYNPYIPSVGSGVVPTGVTLTVDPSVMNNGLIELRATLTNVSGITKSSKLGGQDYTLVDTTNQTLDTVLVIPDGQTRMIGGMIQNRETETVNGIPYLKDIPWIGPLAFGSYSRKPVSRRTLLMFITPTIVQERAHKYVAPPDDNEMTPPTFYEKASEQASWSAAAVKRAMEQAIKETEAKYPGFPMPRPAAEETTRTGMVPLPPLTLRHTTETAETQKPSPGRLPVEEQPATKLPKGEIPPEPLPSTPTLPRMEPRMTAPPTSPTLAPLLPPMLPPLLPPMPPGPATPRVPAATTTPTSPPVTAEKPSAAAVTPLPLPPVPRATATPATTTTARTGKPVKPPIAAAPTSPVAARKTPVRPKRTPTIEAGRTPLAPTPTPFPPAPPTSPTAERKPPKAALPPVTFPATGTALVQRSPVEVFAGSRRPSDLPEPAPARPSGQATMAQLTTTPLEGPDVSSYELTVMGPGGRATSASPGGLGAPPPALGTLAIPLETLATAAGPPAPPAPPPGAVSLTRPTGTVVSGQPPAGLAARPAAPAGPGRPAGSATPYGSRPGINPPTGPPGATPTYPPYRRPTPYGRTPRPPR